MIISEVRRPRSDVRGSRRSERGIRFVVADQSDSRAVKFGYEEFDLSAASTYPLASRRSKANAADFARPTFRQPRRSPASIDSLPKSSRRPTSRRSSPRCGRRATADTASSGGIGAHVAQDRDSRRSHRFDGARFVSAIATNGAGVIHDFELALSGSTSEDVDEALGPGRFGMAEETGTALNGAINAGVAPAGARLKSWSTTCIHGAADAHRQRPRRRGRLEIPVTVHVGIGTDIIHMHKDASGAASARAAFETSATSSPTSRGWRTGSISTADPPSSCRRSSSRPSRWREITAVRWPA